MGREGVREQHAAAPSPASPVADGARVGEADLAAIRTAIASYVAAFNRGDAPGLAGHWTAEGEFFLADGSQLQGHEALQQDFAAYFQQSPGARLELLETALQAVSPTEVTETGVARVQRGNDAPAHDSHYQAVHVKTPQGWKIRTVREQDDLPESDLAQSGGEELGEQPTHYPQLQPLEWMVGTWVDEGANVETTCRWTSNKNFLMHSFRAELPGGADFEGTQVIGWDPREATLRSWMFDSDGGFAVGRWTSEEGRWRVQMLSVLPDGRQASATNVYEQLENDQLGFRSIGRQVDGELLPDIPLVKMSRIPAAAATPSSAQEAVR
jgi:ketosteroid isomerase-like protein